jgi:hypothetical protein
MAIQTATANKITLASFFNKRNVVITTMHGKEHVIAPLVKKHLGLDSQVCDSIDTDQFGTFSGEIERVDDPVTTVRKKILEGLRASGATLGIGSEGSFGPHPNMPFVHANQEVVMLIDLENNLEVYDSYICTDTNHAQKEIHSMKDLIDFANEIGFPRHGIILKQMSEGKVKRVRKGIVTWDLLYAEAYHIQTVDCKLIAETDMRAHLNPTRMKAIEKATELMLEKVFNRCPECQWPGFSCIDSKPGLPCKQCGTPTKLAYTRTYQCKNCDYTDERFYSNGTKADPAYCDNCNP